jgi:hypothetical protein
MDPKQLHTYGPEGPVRNETPHLASLMKHQGLCPMWEGKPLNNGFLVQ